MTIQIPEAVQWLVPIVVGTNWPEGDEDALRRLADAWEQAATAIEQVTGEGTAAAQAALDAMQGEAADSFRAYWDRFVTGDEQFVVTLQQACTQLADGCHDAALNIEYTKLSIIAALLILAAQLAAMAAAALATLGASTSGVPIAQAATRGIVQRIFDELVRQLAINVGINVGADVVIQLSQILLSHTRSWKEWDVDGTVAASISGLMAGVAGGGARVGGDILFSTTTNFAQAALRGAGEGALAGAGGGYFSQAVHGDLTLDPQSLVSGAASGGIGGALGGTVSRHEGLHETWYRPESSDYTAGPNTQGWRFTTEDGAEVRANVADPYTRSWNSEDGQHLPARGGPNAVNVDEDGYQLPTWQQPGEGT